jgi:hypothetical protein
MNEPNDRSHPLTATELEQLKQLLNTAFDLAMEQVVQISGRDFLAQVLADPTAHLFWQLEMKTKKARLMLAWPSFDPKPREMCTLRTYSDAQRPN